MEANCEGTGCGVGEEVPVRVAVSGATETSLAIMNAVQAALEQEKA